MFSFTAIHHVTLDENNQPTHYDVRPFAEGQKRPEFPPQRNLGLGSPALANRKPERVSLGMKRDGGQFFLEMTAQLIPSERYLTVVTSRVVETDRNGRDIRERTIFQGRRSREREASRVTLQLPDSRKYPANSNFWQTRYEIRTETDGPLIAFRRVSGILHLSSDVEVYDSAKAMPELPWLVMLGWYLTVMAHNDSAPVV